MERFFTSQQQESSILLGHSSNNSSHSQFRRSSTNPSTPQRNSDVDFNDVFGGPPRRSSVNDTISGEEGWCRWPAEREKPVFGEDSGVRRRHPNRNNNNYFFDDIFGGEESPSACSTPRKRDSSAAAGDLFAFTPLSPARLTHEPLASSLPPAFSLPVKLTKGVDLQPFGSPARSRKQRDVNNASNEVDSSDSHLSRFSTQTAQHKELRNDLKPSYRQSLLSKEFLDLSLLSDEADKGSNMKQETSFSEVSPNSSSDKFHFSIYKWASKGVPLAMPLRSERNSRIKDKVKLEKSFSAKEWTVSEITTENDYPLPYKYSNLMENDKQDMSTTSTATPNKTDSYQTVEQIVSAKAQSDSWSIPQTVNEDVEASSEIQKLESKSLHSLFSESNEKQDYKEMTRSVREENMTKSSKKLFSIFDVPLNRKKQNDKQTEVPLSDVGYSKATFQGPLSQGENTGKGQVTGKVKEFVRILNQEADTIPRVDSKSRPQDPTYKQQGALRTKNDVEGDTGQSKKKTSTKETTNMSANNLSQQDDVSASAATPDVSFTVVGDKDESSHGNFTIQVLAQDEDEVLQNKQNQEIQVINKKIQKWSEGKEGNIRSLLSTLQYVLWPECGWKPVPLVDIIEGNAVKRAYQRALLCLHPDKLQQKGAASDQKYLAEKVFDILQEAWIQFNVLGAL